MPIRLLGTATLVVSTKDLKPDSFICFSRIQVPSSISGKHQCILLWI
jgi:hypothetical protein